MGSKGFLVSDGPFGFVLRGVSMLTKRENFLETMNGGNPDRYVDNFEFMSLVYDVISQNIMPPPSPGKPAVSAWGVTSVLEEGLPGPMPLTEGEYKVITDVTCWRDQLKSVPKLSYTAEEWQPVVDQVKAIDRNETFVTALLVNGIFEKVHYLMGMEDAMINLYEEPEAMHDLIDFFVDFELKQAEEIIKYMHPDAIYHHDDWGTQRNSFLSPEMFEEFLVPAYEKIYGFWKENGVEVVVHHNDSYSANLLPYFKRMHIDAWQGVIIENDIPKCIAEHDQHGITIIGGLNNGVYDKPDTTYEEVEAGVRDLINSIPNQGKHYFVPGLTMGLNYSVFPEVYDMASKAIAKVSEENF